MRTRVKICGVTTAADAAMIARLGADAVGVVLAESKRRVDVARAREIAGALPPLVSLVGVFMDQALEVVRETASAVPLDFVQLHGAEPAGDVAAMGRRVIKRLNVRADTTREDLLRLASEYRDAAAILLDPGAGDGKTFDWSILLDRSRATAESEPRAQASGVTLEGQDAFERSTLPRSRALGVRMGAPDFKRRLIVSGGLTPTNVGDVVRLLRPMAVDVSSGVERSPRVKDEAKVRDFLQAVRDADASFGDC
ncbi:MAG: phosphoribosylanthranilate isomerase [Phycisphaerae bacterium]